MEVPPFLQFPHLTSRLAHQVGQRDMGRTNIGAASAVHAVLRMGGSAGAPPRFPSGPGPQRWGRGAWGRRRRIAHTEYRRWEPGSRGCSQGAQTQKAVGVGQYRGLQALLGHPCHGAAHQDQARLLPEAAGRRRPAPSAACPGGPTGCGAGLPRPPVTVTARWVRGRPLFSASPTAKAAETLKTTQRTSSARPPGGTSRRVTDWTICFSAPMG